MTYYFMASENGKAPKRFERRGFLPQTKVTGMKDTTKNTTGKRVLIDMVGKKVGRFTVIDRAANSASGRPRWNCRCECGSETVVWGDSLRNGNTLSCGCVQRERVSEANRKVVDGLPSKQHPLYGTWCGMLTRCTNPNFTHYQNYGGRGIKVCDRWIKNFAAFVEDVGEKPTPLHTLDRINNDSNYEPGNVRWATRTEQNRNRRDNRIVDIFGEKMTLAAAAEKHGVNYQRLHHVINTEPAFLSSLKAA